MAARIAAMLAPVTKVLASIYASVIAAVASIIGATAAELSRLAPLGLVGANRLATLVLSSPRALVKQLTRIIAA